MFTTILALLISSADASPWGGSGDSSLWRRQVEKLNRCQAALTATQARNKGSLERLQNLNPHSKNWFREGAKLLHESPFHGGPTLSEYYFGHYPFIETNHQAASLLTTEILDQMIDRVARETFLKETDPNYPKWLKIHKGKSLDRTIWDVELGFATTLFRNPLVFDRVKTRLKIRLQTESSTELSSIAYIANIPVFRPFLSF